MKPRAKMRARTSKNAVFSPFLPQNRRNLVTFCVSVWVVVFYRDSTTSISYKYLCNATEERYLRESSLSFSLNLFSFWIFIVFSSFLLWRKFVRRRSHCNSRWQINTRCFCSFHISFVIYLFLLFICFFISCNHLIQKSCFVYLPPWVIKSPHHNLLISPPWTYSIE